MVKVHYADKDPVENVVDLLENSIFDETDPKSLINLLSNSSKFRNALMAVKWPRGQWFFQSEKQLRKWAQPSETDERLRISFWDEYAFATRNNRKMNLNRAFHGLVSQEYLEYKLFPDDKKMVFMVTMPENYMLTARHLLNIGMDRFKEILTLPLTDDKGKPDTRVINAIIKVTEIVDQRVKGAVVQRMLVDQRSMNLNVNATPQEASLELSKMSLVELEDLENRLNRLDGKTSKLLPPERRQEIEAEDEREQKEMFDYIDMDATKS